MYTDIILLVGFSMVITLLITIVPKDLQMADAWKAFCSVFATVTILTLGIYLVADYLSN